jgi:cytochrome P450
VNQTSAAIPDHVPSHLVRDYPLAGRRVIYENPYDGIIQKAHEGPPIFMAPNGHTGISPAWIVRRYADINQIFSDNVHFIKRGNTGFSGLLGEEWDAIPTELDPPRHTDVRRVLNPLFTPAKVADLEAKVRQRAREYIGRFKDKGSCDLAADFAIPYPVSIFLDLFGLPQDGMEKFLEWEHALLHAHDVEERRAGMRAVKDHLMQVIEERRRNPTGDLISNALAIEIKGEPFSTIEVFGHCFNLYIGGLDTVTATISLHMYHLATHPDHQRQLREKPEMIKTAMNELLRAYSPTVHNRICAKEYEIAGVRMMPGDKVVLAPPLGNRDPEHWDAPDEIRFDRVGQNLTFGSGIHNCLGRHLARREVQVALEELLAALPEFRLVEGRQIPFRVGSVIHAAEVPVEW